MKVYLYSRVSTDLQSTAQQERTAYEWLKAHNMQVDEVVSDEGISGGVSFADRNLGRVLLPKMNTGDVLIVSEVSRLGRSMFDLSKLIHTELKPRKIRLVCVSMGIDLRCDKMTAIDELILNNFSFAAQLEKQLISERTLSALAVKRKQGVKLGAASDNYNITKDSATRRAKKAGSTRTRRVLENRDVIALIRIMKNVFPKCNQIPEEKWCTTYVTTRYKERIKMLTMMRDYKEMDVTGKLFAKWDLSDLESVALQHKLASKMQTIIKIKTKNED